MAISRLNCYSEAVMQTPRRLAATTAFLGYQTPLGRPLPAHFCQCGVPLDESPPCCDIGVVAVKCLGALE